MTNEQRFDLMAAGAKFLLCNCQTTYGAVFRRSGHIFWCYNNGRYYCLDTEHFIDHGLKLIL